MYTLKQIIDKAYQELLNSGLSRKTVRFSNLNIWKKLVKYYGEDAFFSCDLCRKYCEECFGRNIFDYPSKYLLKTEQNYLRAFNRLIQSSKDESFKKFEHHHLKCMINQSSVLLLDNYLQKCKDDGNSTITLLNKEKIIRNFMIDIDFKNITKSSIIEYVGIRKKAITFHSYAHEMNMIFRFLTYCYENSSLDKSILMLWPTKFANTKDKQIPSTYTLDEISQLLTSAKNYTNEKNHYRNYAILCLVAYTGMRANDVIHLTPSNINWRNNTIHFVQQKSKKEQVYPLLPQIGNPIIEYIKHERPSGKYLFLKKDGNQISIMTVSNTINVYFVNSQININGRHYGAHALRHSIATNMVNSGVSMFSVANSLGHSNIECVKIYGKVNLVNLRKCVLEAPYHE